MSINLRMFMWCNHLSLIYACVITTLVFCSLLADAANIGVLDSDVLAVFFSTLYIGSILFYFYLEVEQILIARNENHAANLSSKNSYELNYENGTTSSSADDGPSEIPSESANQVDGRTFAQTKEVNMYLRCWCWVFGIGCLIWVTLKIYSNTMLGKTCPQNQFLFVRYFQAVFFLMQTFFIFRNGKIKIKWHPNVTRFATMHIIATNFCTWLWVMIYELLEDLEELHTEEELENYTTKRSTYSSSLDNCTDNLGIMEKVNPYLYPMMLEFSLSLVCIMSSLFISIGEKKKKTEHEETAPRNKSLLQASHKGLFLGSLVFTITVISMIIYQFLDEYRQMGAFAVINIFLNGCCIMTIMYLFCTHSSYKIFQSHNAHIDLTYLLIAGIASFMVSTFDVVAYIEITYGSEKDSIASMLIVSFACAALVRYFLQTLFLINGLQEGPKYHIDNGKHLGRNSIMLLIIMNISDWFMMTVLITHTSPENVLTYIGDVPGIFLEALLVPLILFYRFHSSVCLVDIWLHAY